MSPLENLRILVVDDEPLIRQLLVEDLSELGAVVAAAGGGDEAWPKLAAERFDVVVSDVRMPDGDGLRLLARAREARREPRVFFLMSGFSELTEAEAVALGATGCLYKPFPLDELVQRIVAVA